MDQRTTYVSELLTYSVMKFLTLVYDVYSFYFTLTSTFSRGLMFHKEESHVYCNGFDFCLIDCLFVCFLPYYSTIIVKWNLCYNFCSINKFLSLKF